MKTATAYIIYDPLVLSFSIVETGGSTVQRKDALTGGFDPDRTLFPLVLKPLLEVQDPNHVLEDGDHSDKLIDCRWYIGSDENGTRIDSSTSGLTPGTGGTLTVSRNVEPSMPLNLFFTCAYIDARTQNTFRKSMSLALSSVLATELNLSLEIDAAAKMPVSPFKTHRRRTITATLRNGDETVSDDDAVYVWNVLDASTRQMRAITDDDLFYVSGQGTKALTVDRRFIDKELIEVVACHSAVPSRTVSARTKAFRWYGQWDDEVRITRGKYIRTDTTEIEVQALVNTPKGIVDSPADYYDITHVQTSSVSGAPQTVIGYGESVTVPRSSVGSDPNARPVFGIETRERTALRACLIDGSACLVDGAVMCISIPIDNE